MGASTAIQWATHTFNPWIGCEKVSAGCTNCYAETYDRRVGGVPKAQRDPNKGEPQLRWGKAARRTRTSPSYWRQPLRWNRVAAELGKRHRVFCASLADVFEDRPDLIEWRAQLLDLIVRTPHLDWLLLTKRPESIRPILRATLDFFESTTTARHCDAAILLRLWLDGVGDEHARPTPPTNVWMGTTVENQEQAEKRIPHLLEVPARVRFLSCEPLLGPVDLSYWLDEDRNGFQWRDGNAVQWVIIGGESGPKARPFHIEWAADLVEQCETFGVTPFVKQFGGFATWDFYEHRRWADRSGFDLGEIEPIGWLDEEFQPPPGVRSRFKTRDRSGGDWDEWPSDLRVREFPEVA